MIVQMTGVVEREIAAAQPGQRLAITLSVYNADAASATLTVAIYDKKGTSRIDRRATLDIGVASIIYRRDDPGELDEAERMVIYLAAAPTTQPNARYTVYQR